MTKKTIKGVTKTAGKFVLKGVTKALGLGLAGSGIIVNALSKGHIVRGIGNIVASIVCPTASVSVAEAMLAKDHASGAIGNNSIAEGITTGIRKSLEITNKLSHEIGKGLQDTGKSIGRQTDRLI